MIERETVPGTSRLRAQLRRLSPPARNIDIEQRELLLRSLDVARSGQLTILVGPSGFGKTTTLGQWWDTLRHRSIPAAWYTASDLDREPDVFLQMLALSLSQAGVDMRDMALGKAGNASPKATLEAILLKLETFHSPLVIIIDDFERIDHPPIVQIIDTIMDTLPGTAHLVLATRRKPGLNLAAMRARGAVRIFEPTELRLDPPEIAQMLGPDADADELALVNERTEGWPVAVQLYKLWRARMGERGGSPGFGGQVEEVADYLTEQVLADLSPELRELVFDMAGFDYIEPALADRVRGRTDSAALLEEFARLLPALVQHSMVEGETAYRLHPLLADFAQARGGRRSARSARIHAEAATWLLEQERYAAAIRCAVQSGRGDVLTHILESLPFLDVFLAYGAGELRAILREAPGPAVEAMPRIRLMAALAHFKTGAFGAGIAMLETVRERLAAGGGGAADARALLECDALDLVFSVYVDGPIPDAEARIASIVERAPDNALIWAWCENALLVVHQERGDLVAARQSVQRTREIYETGGMLGFAEAHLLTHDMLILLAAGRLRQASELAAAILRGPRTQPRSEPVVLAMARMTQGVVEHHRNYRERAGDAIRLALEQFGEGEAWFDHYAIAYPVIADVIARRHGRDAAVRMIESADARLRARGMGCCAALLRALAWLYRVPDMTREEAAQLCVDPQLLADLGPRASGVAWRTRDIANRTLAAAALKAGRNDLALAAGAALTEDGRAGGRLGTVVKGLVIEALALETSGEVARADEKISEAVRAACTESMTAAFAEEGGAIRPLLQRARDRADTALDRQHVEAVLRTLDANPQFRSPDMLSDREAEIVAHLADGASNKLIARRLGLTDNTVKFHLKKVYAKLGVSSRKEAVARMMEDS